MSKPFPADNPFLVENMAPWPMEGDVHDLVIDGEIPRELEGSFFRNGPNPQFAPIHDYHWFEGDGMIHAFRIEGGRCHYRNRFVRTAKFELERSAGQALFGGIGMPPIDPRTEGMSPNTSNTHVLHHAGKLLSLWEAGLPHVIDPVTLETIGPHDYDGAFERERLGTIGPDIMTAHPKIDPDTGEWIGFGYCPIEPYLVYHVVDADGKLARSDALDAPFPAMMHDFIVSSQHAVFPIFPFVFDLAKIAETGSPLNWEPERGVRVGVLPRDGRPDDMIWLSHDPCFSFHVVNARTVEREIIAELWITPELIFRPEEGRKMVAPNLHRWTIDLDTRSIRDEKLDDTPAEFGRIDDRRAGKGYRYLWSLGNLGGVETDGEPGSFNAIFRYDLQRGERSVHRLPAGDSAGEPIFVPRGPAVEEGDGFVLSIVHRAAENRSDLLILDAQNIEAAPLAIAMLPHRIPYGFHGSWVSASSA